MRYRNTCLLLGCLGLSAAPTIAASQPVAKSPEKSAAASPGKSQPASCFGPLSSVPLPEALGWARDVRFVGEQEVLLSAYGFGLVRLRLDRPSEPPKTELPQGLPRTAAGAIGAIGVSDRYIVLGSPIFSVGWMAKGSAGPLKEEYFEFTQDVDVYDDRLAILGMRKTKDGRGYEQGGAYLWLGRLGDSKLEELRPIAFSTDGLPGKRMDACSPVGVGALRFLEEGSLVAVPLAEPGVFLFRADGRLTRTWRNEEFGLAEGCDVTEEMLYRLSLDPRQQMQWINSRRVVDDILPLGADRWGLIVRRHEGGVTRWRMEIANSQGPVESCEIGLEVASPWVELRAAARGSRVALLRHTRRHQFGVKEPIVPPQLLLGDISPRTTSSTKPKVNP